jgi:hypothetical protein
MPASWTSRGLSVAIVVLMLLAPQCVQATPPDSTLYTNYFFGTNYQSVSWVVCGSTQQSSGCYSSGSLGPFGKVGTLLEGYPAINFKTNTVTRKIYVLDIAAGSGGADVILYVYKKTDVITPSYDAATTSLTATIPLPLTGGGSARASMAANKGFLFVGTDQSPFGQRIQKSDLSMVQIGGFSPPLNVSSVTANSYGYITVTFGTSGGFTGNIEFGPNGNGLGDGGGPWFMLNTTLGVVPSTIPTF